MSDFSASSLNGKSLYLYYWLFEMSLRKVLRNVVVVVVVFVKKNRLRLLFQEHNMLIDYSKIIKIKRTCFLLILVS